jgi:hypothetical protein
MSWKGEHAGNCRSFHAGLLKPKMIFVGPNLQYQDFFMHCVRKKIYRKFFEIFWHEFGTVENVAMQDLTLKMNLKI